MITGSAKKMAKKSKKIKGGGLVYSTDKETMSGLFSGINLGTNEKSTDGKKTLPMIRTEEVRVWMDRKNRKGKAVILIKGLNMKESELKDLAKFLKEKCGVGGSAKNGEIILQGNDRDKVVKLLNEQGFINAKKAGG